MTGLMDSTKRHSYCSLVTALKTRFGTTGQWELSLVKIHNRRRRKGEPLPELAEDIERLSRLVYREVPSRLQDEHAKEQFIDALTDDYRRIRLVHARPTSLHEARRLAVELESYNMAVRQSPSIRAVTVTEDSASKEKAPAYEQLKETLLVVAEGVQKLLLEKRAALLKVDRLDARNAAKCWNCGKVGHFRRACRQSPRQTEWASTSSRYPGNEQQPASRGGDRQ